MSKSNELPSKRQEEIVLPKTKAQTAHFTQISNEVLLDQRLSYKARGILALLLSRPKNWQIYIDEIVERSDCDGKHSVQTGFKELKALGYVELVKIWNKETGKFKGTVYQLCLNSIKKVNHKGQKNLNSQQDFPIIEEIDQPIYRPTENQSIEKPDRPKTMTPSNTNSSNTKHSNTLIQQQQVEPLKFNGSTVTNDDVFLKNSENEKTVVRKIEPTKTVNEPVEPLNFNGSTTNTNVTATKLLPYLQTDDNWKKQFIGKQIGQQINQNTILTAEKLALLLQHFAKTSISSGTTYVNVAAIKRHFFNWFNANLKKDALSSYIEAQTVLPKKTRKQVKALLPKTDAILNKIYSQQCDNETHLSRCLQLLATHAAIYENALQYFDKEEKTIINNWLSDIQKVNNLVQRGQKAGKLYWFCAKKSQPKARPKSQSKATVNQAITGLSQRFSIIQN